MDLRNSAFGNCHATKRNICSSQPIYTCLVTKGYMTTSGMGSSCVAIAHVIAVV